jgi:hypothetical protein
MLTTNLETIIIHRDTFHPKNSVDIKTGNHVVIHCGTYVAEHVENTNIYIYIYIYTRLIMNNVMH